MENLIWLPLKLQTLPLIDREVRNLHDEFNSIRKNIKEGDLAALQRCVQMRPKLEARLEQINRFINENYYDDRVKYLRAGRTLLAKMVANYHHFSKINEDSHSVPWKNDTRRLNKQTEKISQTKKRSKVSVSPIKSGKFKANKGEVKPNQINKENRQSQSNRRHSGDTFTLQNSLYESKRSLNKSPLHQDSNNKDQNLQLKKSVSKKCLKKDSSKQSLAAKPSQPPQNSAPSTHQSNDQLITKMLSSPNLSDMVFNIKFTKQQFAEIMKVKRKAKQMS